MGLSRNAANSENKTQAYLHEGGERSSAVSTCMRCMGLLQEGHAQATNWHVGHNSQMKTEGTGDLLRGKQQLKHQRWRNKEAAFECFNNKTTNGREGPSYQACVERARVITEVHCTSPSERPAGSSIVLSRSSQAPGSRCVFEREWESSPSLFSCFLETYYLFKASLGKFNTV